MSCLGEQVNRKGFYLDVLPLSKPVVNYGFSFAFCSLLGESVELKVSEDGCFIACVFDGARVKCSDCPFKKYKRKVGVTV